jgi:hypothetical protein
MTDPFKQKSITTKLQQGDKSLLTAIAIPIIISVILGIISFIVSIVSYRMASNHTLCPCQKFANEFQTIQYN